MKENGSDGLARLRKSLEELDLALYDSQDLLAFHVWDKIKDQVVPPGTRRENGALGLLLTGEAATEKMDAAVALARGELEIVMTSPSGVYCELEAMGDVEYTNPGIFVSLYPMVMEALIDTMALEIVDPQELRESDRWNPVKRQFWVEPPWEWWRNGYAKSADEPKPATTCYLCGVQESNSTPYDPMKHHICVICSCKLWELATRDAGIMFDLRGTTVFLTHGRVYDRGDGSDEAPLLIYPHPN